MWTVLLTVSILYCWLYEVAHGHPVGDLIPTIRWSFQAWAGWMTLSVLWFLSWRSGNKLEKLWQHRRGWIPILIATPFIAVLIEWKIHLLFSSMGWESYRSGNYWILLYDRAPWALVASSTLAILSYLYSRRALPTERAPHTTHATSHAAEMLAAPLQVSAPAPRQEAHANHVHTSHIGAHISLDMQKAPSATPANEVSFAGQLSVQARAVAERGMRANVAHGIVAQISWPAVQPVERLRVAETPSVPTLRLTTQAGPTDVPATAIEAIIAAENYVEVCLSDGKHYLHRATLQSVGDALEGPSLIRVRRSAIVNLDHVQGRLSDWRLRLTSGRIVRVGRTYRAQFEACRPRLNGNLHS